MSNFALETWLQPGLKTVSMTYFVLHDSCWYNSKAPYNSLVKILLRHKVLHNWGQVALSDRSEYARPSSFPIFGCASLLP